MIEWLHAKTGQPITPEDRRKLWLDASRFRFADDGTVSTANIPANGGFVFTAHDPATHRVYPVHMPVTTFAFFLKVFKSQKRPGDGVEEAEHLALAGVHLSGLVIDASTEQRVAWAIAILYSETWKWLTVEDFLTEYSYIGLRNGFTPSHADAAALAGFILGRIIKPDAWRMRVKKFAKDAGLPALELRKRNKTE